MMDLVLIGLLAFYLGKNFEFDFSQNQEKDDSNGLPTWSKNGRPKYVITADGITMTNPDTNKTYSAHRLSSVAYNDETGEQVVLNPNFGVVFENGKYRQGLYLESQPAGRFTMSRVDEKVNDYAKSQAQKDAEQKARDEENERKRKAKEEEEREREERENFERHIMYSPDGRSTFVDSYEEHLELLELGWSHEPQEQAPPPMLDDLFQDKGRGRSGSF
tara:strand:- start:438 stop:1091 length:654 start_codon:yes stop_codon:yes gene_type:complete